jgi:hypothetical protein
MRASVNLLTSTATLDTASTASFYKDVAVDAKINSFDLYMPRRGKSD